MKENINDEEQIYLDILDGILLENHISKEKYGINSIINESICIIKENGIWKVFKGQNKMNEQAFIDCTEACLDVIKRISDSDLVDKIMYDYCDSINMLKIKSKKYIKQK